MGMMARPPAIACGADGPEWAFITGGESLTIDNFNYFVAWCDAPGLGGMPDRRRIICKLIVPVPIAKTINDQARRIWSKGGH